MAPSLTKEGNKFDEVGFKLKKGEFENNQYLKTTNPYTFCENQMELSRF